MTTETESIFIDTNVLVYASVPVSPWHRQSVECIGSLESEGVAIWISGQVIRELLVNLTRDDIRGSRSHGEMIEQVIRMIDRFRVASDTEAVRQALIEIVRRHRVQGKQIHDANIAATCLVNGIPRLLTNNERDFKRYTSHLTIESLTP